ncbi:MAG TPA: hypothetical protein VK111_04830 [Virgibacillus sp.]|nr:hypothetical protein [Virgibacillus sp.]
MTNIFRNVWQWFKKRLFIMPKRDNRISLTLSLIFLVVSSFSVYLHAEGNPTGATFLSHASNIGKFVGLNILAFPAAMGVLGLILSLLYIPLPRLFLGGFIYTTGINIAVLMGDSSGNAFSVLMGIGVNVAILIVSLIAMVLLKRKIGRMVFLVVAGLCVITISAALLINKFTGVEHVIQVSSDDTIEEENPGQKGDYDYTFFTYGSGDDQQREEFGESVDELTHAVDLSEWITSWKDKRTEFWGYGPSEMPINGRVWEPEGEGPFPVVLMVHGNHVMEEFSTDGYDYLGELLASRGFIAISVDEDFINYSNVSGSPNDNYKLRAYMILEHIQELQHMNQSSESKLYHKIDFDDVALMGHSRGGQAVLMAADYETFFPEDEDIISSMDDVNIKGVVSIAPTDKTIDGNKPHLSNVSYLFLGGGMDADVSDFRGDRQYYRTSFEPGSEGFKSTLYIPHANHTQFNSSWGRSDLSMPRGLFLNYKEIMEPDEQRKIAEVYMGAFMESVLHDDESYRELFEDYRSGGDWLPDTQLVNKYQDSTYWPVVEYSQDDTEDRSEAEAFNTSKVTTPKDRANNDRLSDALELEWDSEATYSINLSPNDFTTNLGQDPEQLVLTMANMDDEATGVPVINVELETTDGASVELPLEDYALFPPVMDTKYTAFGLFDGLFRDGKYEPAWEPVFQTFTIPMEAFEEADESMAYDDIDKITLHFDGNPGKVFIEEIGVQ